MRRRMAGWAAVAVILALAACSGGSPVAPAVETTRSDSAALGPAGISASESEGCRAVSGTLREEGTFLAPPLVGSLGGDLHGSTALRLTGFRRTGNPDPTGNFAGHNSGQRTWLLTGGDVPALIGRTLTLSFEAMATNPEPGLDRRGDWHESARITAGARSGHLNLQGIIDGRGLPNFVFELRYRGVICP